MASTVNCVVCGSSIVEYESGHVHIKNKVVMASLCNACGKITIDAARKLRNVEDICGQGCFGTYIPRDGLKGWFRKPGRGKAYPAIDELKRG